VDALRQWFGWQAGVRKRSRDASGLRTRRWSAQLVRMADKNQPVGERIGVPDPKHEPQPPPKIDTAGKLGPVGERKQEKDDLNDRDGIWRNPAARGRDE